MLRQAGVSINERAELSGHSIETAMKYGWPKAREKERAVESLDEMAAIVRIFSSCLLPKKWICCILLVSNTLEEALL